MTSTLRAMLLLSSLPLLPGCVGAAVSVATTAASVGAQAGFASGVATAAGPSVQQVAALPAGEVAALPVAFGNGVPANLAAGRKVFVPAYGVSYIHTQNARAVSQGGLMGGFGGGSTRSASVRTGLTGISPATYQMIADEAHADLIAQLRAAGIEVAGAEEAAAAASSAPRVPGNAADGSAGGTMFGGQSTGWRTLGAAAAPLISGISGEGAGGGLAGLSAIGGNQAMQRIADQSQGLVLAPLLRLDYVNVSSSGRSLLAGTANAEATAQFSVAAGTQLAYAARRPGMGAADIGIAQIAAPVPSAEPFAGISATGGSSGAWVGLGTRTDAAVEAVEARWVALARAAYRGFNAAIVQQLRAARPNA
ncbi:hypothetical protein [Falsiroseomonas sp. CW058]|uniref:hypothetical protein n=1 Tax=Falsiroseomonas sp. CW058 TaxID=3388664 RepID=UPI003D321449